MRNAISQTNGFVSKAGVFQAKNLDDLFDFKFGLEIVRAVNADAARLVFHVSHIGRMGSQEKMICIYA